MTQGSCVDPPKGNQTTTPAASSTMPTLSTRRPENKARNNKNNIVRGLNISHSRILLTAWNALPTARCSNTPHGPWRGTHATNNKFNFQVLGRIKQRSWSQIYTHPWTRLLEIKAGWWWFRRLPGWLSAIWMKCGRENWNSRESCTPG